MTTGADAGGPLGEMRMLGEYIAREYPQATVFLRLRLGVIQPVGNHGDLDPAELRFLSALARYADAVVILPQEIVIVEAKMRSEPGAIAQLGLYARLAPMTPDLQPYLNRPIVKELVCSVPDPVVDLLARESEVRVKVYAPSWLPAWSAKRNRNKIRAPSPGGLLPR